jgi:predicted RNA binding protein YcfA (HicA-like mRNA interferase family)
MVTARATRRVVRELRDAGFEAVRTRGSHTLWVHPEGPRVPVPDGHATISPGVYRQVLRAIAASRHRPAPEEEEE